MSQSVKQCRRHLFITKDMGQSLKSVIQIYDDRPIIDPRRKEVRLLSAQIHLVLVLDHTS